MKPIKLFINGEDALIHKDAWGRTIDYQKCKDLKTDKYFLNMWSKGRYLLGTSNIWKDVKGGDILTLVHEEGKLSFEFKDGRFWMVKDELQEEQLKQLFVEQHNDVVNVVFSEGYLVATFDLLEAKYRIEGERFIEVSRVSFESTEASSDENAIRCTRSCYFQENGVCKYFDWELLESSGQEPDCGEPFIYLEQ